MSTVIRLSIVGKVHQRSYRLFAQDKRSKRDGKFLEILGNINPALEESKQVVLKKDRIAYWQKHGAQLSKTAEYLIKHGKLPPRPKKDRAKKETVPAPQPQGEAPEGAKTQTESKVESASEPADSAAKSDTTTAKEAEEKSAEEQSASQPAENQTEQTQAQAAETKQEDQNQPETSTSENATEESKAEQ